jgi:hypothetical protein
MTEEGLDDGWTDVVWLGTITYGSTAESNAFEFLSNCIASRAPHDIARHIFRQPLYCLPKNSCCMLMGDNPTAVVGTGPCCPSWRGVLHTSRESGRARW